MAALPAVLFFLFLFGIPQSPRWLAARGGLKKLGQFARDRLARSRKGTAGDRGFDPFGAKVRSEPLFQTKFRLPIFLAIFTGVFNQLSGINAILYYLNDIFAQAGFSNMSATCRRWRSARLTWSSP